MILLSDFISVAWSGKLHDIVNNTEHSGWISDSTYIHDTTILDTILYGISYHFREGSTQGNIDTFRQNVLYILEHTEEGRSIIRSMDDRLPISIVKEAILDDVYYNTLRIMKYCMNMLANVIKMSPREIMIVCSLMLATLPFSDIAEYFDDNELVTLFTHVVNSFIVRGNVELHSLQVLIQYLLTVCMEDCTVRHPDAEFYYNAKSIFLIILIVLAKVSLPNNTCVPSNTKTVLRSILKLQL